MKSEAVEALRARVNPSSRIKARHPQRTPAKCINAIRNELFTVQILVIAPGQILNTNQWTKTYSESASMIVFTKLTIILYRI